MQVCNHSMQCSFVISSSRLVGEGLNPEKINIKVFWCHLMHNGITNNILKIPMNRIWGNFLAEL